MSRPFRARSASTFAAVVGGLVLLAVCQKDYNPHDPYSSGLRIDPTNSSRTSISVKPGGLSLEVGRSAPLQVVVVPEGLRVEWFSLEPYVASVSAVGLVTCKEQGSTRVTAQLVLDPDFFDTAYIECRAAPPQPPAGDLFTVSTGTLSFVHSIGVTECSQLVGEIDVTNTTSTRISVSLRSNNGAIEVSAAEMVLEPGASRRVKVRFNCSTKKSFNSNIKIEANDGSGKVDSATVRVEAIIIQ